MTDETEARRETPLAGKLKDRIRRTGPLTVSAYVQACLQDPEFGYYVKQQAIGRMVGAVMKLSAGQANPKVVQQKLREKLT